MVRRPSAARQAVQKRSLDEGDWVEYGLTIEFKNSKNASFWPKASAGSTVREGETADEAMGRVVEFVTDLLNEQVAVLRKGSG